VERFQENDEVENEIMVAIDTQTVVSTVRYKSSAG
jgi:hypothetical protein